MYVYVRLSFIVILSFCLWHFGGNSAAPTSPTKELSLVTRKTSTASLARFSVAGTTALTMKNRHVSSVLAYIDTCR